MEIFTDVVFLSRLQFALTVAYHFLFVPMSIGLGLIMAIAQTRAYRSKDPKDAAGAQFWVKIFTATFVVGVATGITMEFAFGTNWADYSRFVGDIFGAPLAAEALLAFFLESSFLGVVLFGKKKVSPRFYMVSSWLVWAGSALSALWILIANSWMNTPAGYEVVDTATGTKAVLTSFWEAALNPSIGARYLHTVDALIIFGAFVAIAIGCWQLLKGRKDFGKKTIISSTIVAVIAVIIMMPAMHMQASVVAETQPEKLAAMEGQWESGPVGLSVAGWVDETNHMTYTISVPIEGMTSWLASGDFTTVYPGLEDFDSADIPPVTIVFHTYHIMVAMFGVIGIMLILALIVAIKLKKGKKPAKGLMKVLMWSPLAAIIAIECGWMTTEIGRQPWIVWHELRTTDAISQSVSAGSLILTIIIFIVLYTIIAIVYVRTVLKYIRKGPLLEDGTEAEPALEADDAKTGAEAEAKDTAAAETKDGE